jgi:PAS domain S-box-containing protein
MKAPQEMAHTSETKVILHVVITYVVGSSLWILFSDQLVASITSDPATIAKLSTYKGWVFVLVTGVLLAWILKLDLKAKNTTRAALLESEERVRLLGDNLPDSYVFQYMRDAAGVPRFLYLSAGVEKLHGVKAEQLIQDASLLLRQIDPDQKTEWETAITRSREKVEDFAIDVRMRRTDGQWRWFQVRSRPSPRPGGQTIWNGVATDVTERREVERQIRELNTALEQKVLERTAKLEAANKELEGFSYSVSHDLRAPLRAINGYARILAEDYGSSLDAEGQRLLDIVRSEALRMGRLIDDLLKFSRLGRQQLQIEPTDMTTLAGEVFQDLLIRTPDREVDFSLSPLPWAQGDESLLRQVWVNLLDNALKYTRPRKRAAITVTGSLQGNEATYTVKDNGAGFDMKYADKLFGVFQRLHENHEFEGAGVGLALVQRLIQRHGGRIWAESEVDQGATFHFTLPAIVQACAAPTPESTGEVPGILTSPQNITLSQSDISPDLTNEPDPTATASCHRDSVG